MRRLAKAMSAFTNGRSGSADGRDARSFAGRGVSLRVDGSGASSHIRPTDWHYRASLLAAGLAVAVLVALTFSSVAKAEVYVPGPTFCTATGPAAGECQNLRGIAVDQTTRNIYVIDAKASGPNDADNNARINQFRSDGSFVRAFGVDVVPGAPTNVPEVCTSSCQKGAATGLGAVGTGAIGIAVDPETHIVYFVAGANKVAFYDGTTGEFLGEFLAAGSPAAGQMVADPPAPQAFAATRGLALDTSDPDQHYLWVVKGNGTTVPYFIDKFEVPVVDGTGAVTSPPAYVCQLSGRDTPNHSTSECKGDGVGTKDGAFDGFLFGSTVAGANIGVDEDGNVYVAEAPSRNTISKFSPAGAFLTQFNPSVSRPAALAVSPGGNPFSPPDNVFTAVGGASDGLGGTRIHEYEPGPPSPAGPDSDFGLGVLADSRGIAVRSNGVVYAADFSSKRIRTFTPKPTGYNILAIDDTGTGAGSFTCDTGSGPEPCAASYPEGETITVAAVPDEFSAFAGWSGGGCSGTGTCTITEIDADTNVTGEFDYVFKLLALGKDGSGNGSFTCDTGSGPAPCAAGYAEGTPVTVVAVPDAASSSFEGWLGPDAGDCDDPVAPQCELTMDADKSLVAIFDLLKRQLSVTVSGNGSVTSVPPGEIECAPGGVGTCEAEFDHGTVITLEGEPGPNTQAAHWGGCSTISTPNRCVVTLNGDREVGAEFASALPFSLKADCDNQAFRTGLSAFLPACRAYEMVSPVDKNGGDIETMPSQKTFNSVRESHDQSSPDGEGITYSSKTSFGDNVEGAPWSSQYLAHRDPTEGWQTRGISPPRKGLPGIMAQELAIDYKAFSEDLSRGWFIHDAEGLEVGCAPPNSMSLYRRDNLASSYEVLHCEPVPPAGLGPKPVELQGFSADGCYAIVRSKAKLTADANGTTGETSVYQLYLSNCNGELRHVGKLPGGGNCASNSSAGSSTGFDNDGRAQSVENAFSTDAKRLYWSCGTNLHLRTDPEPAVEGEIGEEATLVSSGAHFHKATADGSKALYTSSNTLRLFDAAAGTSTAIAGIATGEGGGLIGLLGTSDDLSKAYFASTQALDSTPNSVGRTAQPGQPNVFLYEAGEDGPQFSFVATLTGADMTVNRHISAPTHRLPFRRAARVTPDGSHVAFVSSGQPTGYDNTDANDAGKTAAEVFLYDATANGGAGELLCVSCNPTGQRPVGGRSNTTGQDGLWIAAQVPGWLTQFHPTRALSADGSRLFFESHDALVPRDTNGRRDVYEWARAGSAAGCEALGAELHVPKAGGCISLISTGRSPRDANFVDADSKGDDVFFKTSQSLLPQDPGSVDIYDAKVGGGFPAREPAAECEGEACQSPPAPPAFQTPSSSAFQGAGNASAAPGRCNRKQVRRGKRCVAKRALARRACAKRRGKAKRRCVASQMRRLNRVQRRQIRAANSNGRAGR